MRNPPGGLAAAVLLCREFSDQAAESFAGPGDLKVCVRELPQSVDALALLELHPDEAPHFFMENPAGGQAVAGVGEVWCCEASGSDRLARIREAFEVIMGVAGVELPLVGGFAFRADHMAEEPWQGFPAARFWVPRLTLQRIGGSTRLIAIGAQGLDGLCDALQARSALVAEESVRVAQGHGTRPGAEPRRAGRARGEPIGEDPLTVVLENQRWRQSIEVVLQAIKEGRLQKAVLARRQRVALTEPPDPVAVLRRLRARQSGCTTFAVAFGNGTFLGSTPEHLLDLRGREARFEAIAGTAFGASNAEALQSSIKDRWEHELVVAGISAAISPLVVRLEREPTPVARHFGALTHLVTSLRADLRAGVDAFEVAERLHPTPATGGVPRQAALDLLATVDVAARGWYAGGVAALFGDQAQVAVPLRCGLLRGCEAWLWAGAGIVEGSDPEREWDETRAKLAPMLDALLLSELAAGASSV